MSKDYEMLNETKIDFNKYEFIELDELEKRRMKKRLISKVRPNRRKSKKIVTAAVAILIITWGMMLNSTVVRGAIKEISNKIDYFFGLTNNEAYDEYINVVGTISEDKGVKITLNEVLIKEEWIIVNINVDATSINESRDMTIKPEVYINGEYVNKDDMANIDYFYNDNGTVNMVQQVEMKNIDINKDLDVKVKYSNIDISVGGPKVGEIKGNWEFTFKDNGKYMADKTHTIEINETIDLGDGYVYNIKEVKISPIDIIVKYNTPLLKDGLNDSKFNDIGFTFTDSNRNEIVLPSANTRNGDFETQDGEDIIMLKSELNDKILLVPYKDPSIDEYDTREEARRYREYFWDNSIEIDITNE